MNGLCASCSKALETSKPDGTSQIPGANDATRTQIEIGSPTRTGPLTEANTASFDIRTRVRPAPAGYDLYRYLGGGGMGDVYLAREHAAERIVAMKFLRAAASPSSAERFLTEVRSLARIDHPHIVRFYNVDLDRADPHFTMEYASGGTLADQVKSEGPMVPREAAELAVKLARATHAAHQADVLHRDLKPSNIVLTADGSPKISDFGLAKRTDFDEELTRTTQTVGTPSFMPPEQISRVHGAFSPASDVYGLGATLFYLLTGRPPFDDPAQDVVLRQVRFDPPPRPRSLRDEIPMDLEAIVLRCLEKKPADRYRTAEELAQDLERFLSGRPPDAPKLTRVRRAKQWCSRNRASIAVSAAASLALLGVFLTGLLWNPPQKTENPVELSESYRKELEDGRPVTLVPEKGVPPWFRVVAGRAAIAEDKESDGAASLESMNMSMTELLPDPGIDRYVLKAEIRFLDRRRQEERKLPLNAEDQPPSSRCGIYIGGATGTGELDLIPHTFFVMNYREYVPAELRKIVPNADADFSPGVIIEGPDSSPYSHIHNMPPSVRFPPVDRLPGRWWPVQIEVTPQGVEVAWGARQISKAEPFARLSVAELNQRQAALREVLKQTRNVKYTEPAWQPRQSIGIWCNSAAVAFRKVTVEPLPVPSP